MGVINIKTEIPGPKSLEFLDRRKNAVANGINTTLQVVIEKAHGAVVHDIDGNSYIDLAAGIGSLNVGHAPTQVVKAMQEQLEHFINPVFNVAFHQPYIELAEKINTLIPGEFPKKTVFFNSGAEAVENAVKIARKFTKRKAIISFERGFHGRTLLAMTLTGKVKGFRNGFGPMATDIYRAPFPYYYHNNQDDETVLTQIERLFQNDVDPYDVAAFIIEPVQGDGGFVVPSTNFMKRLREISDKYGILLIADEVQTGFGRTGKWFAMENFEVIADITVMSKSIAAGMPLSAVSGRKEILDSAAVKELGGTLGGNPLSCVAALNVIKIIEEQNLLERANSIGEQILKRFTFSSEFIGEVRGIGAMIGIEFVKDKISKEPHTTFVQNVVKRCQENGLILITAGPNGNIIRLLPPLVISDEELNESISVLIQVIQEIESNSLLNI